MAQHSLCIKIAPEAKFTQDGVIRQLHRWVEFLAGVSNVLDNVAYYLEVIQTSASSYYLNDGPLILINKTKKLLRYDVIQSFYNRVLIALTEGIALIVSAHDINFVH